MNYKLNLKIHRLHDSLIVYVQSRFVKTRDKKFYSPLYLKKIFEIDLFENLNEQISFYIFNLFSQKLIKNN